MDAEQLDILFNAIAQGAIQVDDPAGDQEVEEFYRAISSLILTINTNEEQRKDKVVELEGLIMHSGELGELSRLQLLEITEKVIGICGNEPRALGILSFLLGTHSDFSEEISDNIMSMLEGIEGRAVHDASICKDIMISQHWGCLGRHRSRVVRQFVDEFFGRSATFDEICNCLQSGDDFFVKAEEFIGRGGLTMVYLSIVYTEIWKGDWKKLATLEMFEKSQHFFPNAWFAKDPYDPFMVRLTKVLVGSLHYNQLHEMTAKFISGFAAVACSRGTGDWGTLKNDLSLHLSAAGSNKCTGAFIVLKEISETRLKGFEGLNKFIDGIFPVVFDMIPNDPMAADTCKLMVACNPECVEKKSSRGTMIAELVAWFRESLAVVPIADIGWEIQQLNKRNNIKQVLRGLWEIESSSTDYDPALVEEMRKILG